jgi:hypothetical protein
VLSQETEKITKEYVEQGDAEIKADERKGAYVRAVPDGRGSRTVEPTKRPKIVLQIVIVQRSQQAADIAEAALNKPKT